MIYEALLGSVGDVGDIFHAALWFFPRTMAFIALLPLFSRSISTWLIKSCVCAALIIMPAIQFAPLVDLQVTHSLAIIGMMLSEALLGVMLCFVILTPYFAYRIAGNLIDNLRGTSFAAQMTSGESGESLPLEEFMTIVYIYLFLTGAGLIQAVELVQGSFIVLPPGVLAMGDLQMWAIPVFELFKKAFVMAFLICAPVIVVLILTELCVAVVAAFTPNVQFYSMQFGLKCLIGLLILLLIFEFMNDAVSQMIRQNLEWISGFLAEVSR
ncbi:EscT/YscT/HrcT family type III secretion system export apparatus protein [Limnobacter sp. CACIAM 66H1]|uniref:EscT/YscT/HrcT family type III secretion system export apparatus protein n=1 Tax=Limnobacter sp. CACIAM 66H1 TaxID=1813033 RepID=UPI001E4FB3E4|nr:flagellar biosynthetic protein FliR [Limnobacter sp. CACIAM 66H1]MCC5641154.1 flagellar biosynthetic protein FliR [Nostoc sp. CHAB 5844]